MNYGQIIAEVLDNTNQQSEDSKAILMIKNDIILNIDLNGYIFLCFYGC